jgi:putative nucleotidyltransferase with HDIG domain
MSLPAARPESAVKANVYIGLITAAGAVVLAYGLWDWHTTDWARYLFYCAIALLASRMKVSLPGVTGTMSMNFLFVLIGITELSRSETLLLGTLGMLVQCLFSAKQRPRLVQILVSVASVACSAAASYAVYHESFLRARSLEAPTMLLLAAATYFVINTFSIAIAIGLTEGKPVWAVWRDSYFWSFPNYLVGAAVALLMSAVSRWFGWQVSLLLLPIVYVIYRSHHLYVTRLEDETKRAEEKRVHAEEVAALHRRTIEVLALAIEAKDQTTADHLTRVEIYAVEVGKELGLSSDEMEALRASALLHDIGKLAVPEYIISKPGKLTPDEFEKMKIHTVVGGEICEQIRFPYAVAPIVRAHHERWDGRGYPDGLAGEQIPIGARILAAVDCLDALASDRQYRRALPLDEAIKVVQKDVNKAFDARVVEVLARRYVELEQMAKQGCGGVEKAKLSVDLKIERGAAPAAGFETVASGNGSNRDLVNFHNSIAGSERQAKLLGELSQELEKSADRAHVFAATRKVLTELTPYDALVFYAVRNEQLLPEYLDGKDSGLFASVRIPVGMGLSGWVAENRKTIINGNPSVEPGYQDDPAKFTPLQSALAAPIEPTGGGITGVLSLYRQDRDAFTNDNLKALVAAGAKLARALETASVKAAV